MNIYYEDCLGTMSRIKDNTIDMVLTSPPYDKLRQYNGYSFNFEAIAKELYRIIKPGGCIVWVVADSTINGSETGTSFRQALFFIECGFKLHDTMIYAKKNFVPLSHKRYEQAFEYMFVFCKGKISTFNGIREKSKTFGKGYNFSKKGSNVKEGSYRRRNEDISPKETKLHGNIFYYSTGHTRSFHPAPFPLELAKDQISTWSNENDLIYDPMAGSGTTGIAAEQLNRRFLGSEISPIYMR